MALSKFLQDNPVCFDRLQLVRFVTSGLYIWLISIFIKQKSAKPFEESAFLRFLAAVPNAIILTVSGECTSTDQILELLNENYVMRAVSIVINHRANRFESICNRNRYFAKRKRFAKTKPIDQIESEAW